MELDKVELLWLQVSAQCGCGEPLSRGEQAAFEPTSKELLCLWCLADLTAGRPRPRHRAPRPGTVETFAGTAVATTFPPPPPAGPSNTGPTNTGPTNTGPTDTGPTNTGPTDTARTNTWSADTEPANTEPADTGPADTEPADTGPASTGPPIAGPANTEPANAVPPGYGPPAGHYAAYPAIGPGPLPGAASRRRGGPGTASTLLVAILLVALAVLGIPHLLARTTAAQPAGSGARSPLGSIAMGSPITPDTPVDSGLAAPPVPSDARATRLSPLPLKRSSSTEYSFLRTASSGQPVAFDPCRPIHVVVNADESPRGGDRLIAEAVHEVSAATGLVLVVDGHTTEPANLRRPSVDERLYGNRWAPVLVAWTHDSANSELAGPVVGMGGPAMAPFRNPSDQHYVTGAVLLDAPDFSRILDEPNGRDIARAVVMHELGHLVGLGHVADRHQLMFESMVGQTGFADGDLEGLRRLGSGPCFSR